VCPHGLGHGWRRRPSRRLDHRPGLALGPERLREGGQGAAVSRADAGASGPLFGHQSALLELERGLLIPEEVLRHLITRQERPARALRGADDADEGDETPLPSAEDELDEDDGTERIDESESEAAPAAID